MSTDKAIGRIAAFVDPKTAHTEAQPTGGMGFFECIERSTCGAIDSSIRRRIG